ncbi:MAG: HD domain-containing protein [Lachnospiraceae bacterium]|nr:HD domain-containing protein [Lachnospiraceae bacterium]
MANYHNLSQELQQRIREDRRQHKENPYACRDEDALRREMDHDRANLWRPSYVRDIEKIMHLPSYNRYADKTQVFSLYKNDDISRRALHVQLVSRIARNIGSVLNLNIDLIEAISLGHDIGHTPFGHAGERILSRFLHENTGRYFNHNVHSVRILDQLTPRNISLQTLDGIICHNGEMEQQEYRPKPMGDFASFERRVEDCYVRKEAIKELVPATLEGCVMRICDIIAYLGKDRQDAERLHMLSKDADFIRGDIGNTNAEIINNMVVNIIENSYGKDHLSMDKSYFDYLSQAKKENYRYIYGNEQMEKQVHEDLEPMFEQLHARLLEDAIHHNEKSYLYRHHMAWIEENNRFSRNFSMEKYRETEPNQLVVDYIASMTDDYFIDLYHEMFPTEKHDIKYVGYFDEEL